MAVKRTYKLAFLFTAIFGIVAMASLACTVVFLFLPHLSVIPMLRQAQTILEISFDCLFLAFVSAFGYRPRVRYFLKNRNNFFFSPLAAAALLLASLVDTWSDHSSRLVGVGSTAFCLCCGWLLRGSKEQSAYHEQRDALDDPEMTRLKLV